MCLIKLYVCMYIYIVSEISAMYLNKLHTFKYFLSNYSQIILSFDVIKLLKESLNIP